MVEAQGRLISKGSKIELFAAVFLHKRCRSTLSNIWLWMLLTARRSQLIVSGLYSTDGYALGQSISCIFGLMFLSCKYISSLYSVREPQTPSCFVRHRDSISQRLIFGLSHGIPSARHCHCCGRQIRRQAECTYRGQKLMDIPRPRTHLVSGCLGLAVEWVRPHERQGNRDRGVLRPRRTQTGSPLKRPRGWLSRLIDPRFSPRLRRLH
jgi:hypothetical protein